MIATGDDSLKPHHFMGRASPGLEASCTGEAMTSRSNVAGRTEPPRINAGWLMSWNFKGGTSVRRRSRLQVVLATP